MLAYSRHFLVAPMNSELKARACKSHQLVAAPLDNRMNGKPFERQRMCNKVTVCQSSVREIYQHFRDQQHFLESRENENLTPTPVDHPDKLFSWWK